MGSNQFQREYIEYLQKRNTELLNRLNDMKESYENRILSKDLNKDYLVSTLEDVLNICTVIPQEIDLFFDKITAAMGVFKNILLRKSEMVQLMEKISKALSSNMNFNTKIMSLDDSVLLKDQSPESKIGKKAGTVKVSPMINGHVISTEPRIYLSRVPGVYTSSRRNETHQLSPIIEASPDTSSDPSNLGCHILKEIKIPLERINLNKMSYNYISEESPKTRFKGPKIWKKSLSSNKSQSDYQRKSIFSENSENINKKLSVGESELPQKPENIDPLEGPSWLYEENTENSSSNRFIDYRRRKHRFATVFDKDEDFCTYIESKPKKSFKQKFNGFDESNKETNDRKVDLEEIKERLSEGSEDFICTSFSSEDGENYSHFEKRRRKSRRESAKKANDEQAITIFNMELKEIPISKNKGKKSSSKTPTYSDSSDGEDIERKSLRRSIKCRKSSRKHLKSLSGRMSSELGFENTPSNYVEREIRSQRSTSIKAEEENDVSVRSESKENEGRKFSKRSRTGSPSEKLKSKKSKSKSKSRSPAIVFQENEGRVKRKAAPTKLIEPTLKTKLRRT